MILWRNIEIFLSFFILIPTPDFPQFYYMLVGNLGSLLYGDVSVMLLTAIILYRKMKGVIALLIVRVLLLIAGRLLCH